MERVNDQPMNLVFVTDSRDGILYAGCRAEGIYKGRRIERTVWCPDKNFATSMNVLENLAISRYRAEMRQIDKL